MKIEMSLDEFRASLGTPFLCFAVRCYAEIVNSTTERDRERAGLCANCRHSRKMTSDRGSVFWLCELSKAGFEDVGQDAASQQVVVLFRPVGQAECDLIRDSGFRQFPPRLPQQPFFYPVLSEEYATQIARDWNTKNETSGFVGYVLRFKVKRSFLSAYPIRTVGSSKHQEYWIPASELPKFNENILGTIEVVSEFRRVS